MKCNIFLKFCKKGLTKINNVCIIANDVRNTSKRKYREVGNLTNQKLLEKKIEESGKKKGYLAKKCGLSRAGFLNCVKGDAFFNTSQIKILCTELNITSLKEKDTIFFA